MPETLWDGGPILYSAPGVFPLGTDSVLLADFASCITARQVLDFGTGSGILSILCAVRLQQASVTALDLSPEACSLARQNIDANGLGGRITVLEGDLRQHRSLLPSGKADLVISNPPYFPENSGPAAGAGLDKARGDSCCSVEALCTAAGWALRWGGAFCLVFRPERICDLFCALRGAGMEPKRLRPVRHDREHGISLLLLEARRGGKPGLLWEPELLLRNEDGSESDELLRIYHRRQPTN